MKLDEKLKLVPIHRKCLLSLDEAVAFSGLGRHSLIMLADRHDLNLVVWSGRKRLFKRRKLDEHLEQITFI